MKKAIIFLFVSLCFGFTDNIFSQQTENQFTKELKQLLNNRNPSEKKIASGIYYKFHQYSENIAKGTPKLEAIRLFNNKNYKIDASNRILLNIKLNSKDENVMMNVVNKIRLFDGKIESIHQGNIQPSEIFCWLPVDQITKLCDIQEISFINTPGNAVYWSEPYTTVGDDQLKASNVRSTFNVDGTGYKIGVLSDGVQSYFYNYIPSEELDNVTILDPGFSGDEGTAMLEIIRDIAPGAQLYFHGLDNTPNYFELAEAISALIAEDCDIIVDDIGFDNEPYFTDWSDLGEVIKDFINQGGMYISSAGNAKKEILDEVTNFDNSYHKFSDGNTYLNVNLSEGSAVILQWKDPWLLPTNDFDLEVYDQQNNLLPGGDNNQQNFLPPFEEVDIENAGSYKIKIKSISGSSNIEFKLWPRGTEIPNNGSNQIFGHSAFPNVISVAAYQGDDETVVSDYSSGGPATMFSSAIFDWTIQNVPTITATAGVETFVGVTGLWPNGNPVFSGTSASAPHIAGLAALYFQKLNGIDQLNKSNFDFINDLKASGDNIDNYTGGIWNYESGYGKANILDAINQAGLTVSTPIITPVSGSFYQSVTCTLSCPTEGATIKYTTDNSDPSNGILYNNQPFTLSTLGSVTVKAKAFKNGFLSSAIKSETYNITNIVAPVVDKVSGDYLTGTWVYITWPTGQDLRLYRTKATDGTIPPDPSNAYFGYELTTHPGQYLIDDNIQKVKFCIADFSITPPVWGPVTYVEYFGKPGLRIAQIDDEITQGNNSFGTWNKWENNQWTPHPDETIFRPTNNDDWYVKASQEFKDPEHIVFRKYNVWNTNLGANEYVNHAKISVGPNTSTVLAHFKQANNVMVTNKLENSFSVNLGSFVFKNPWIVDDNSDSKGPRNRGDGTVVPLLPYTINFSTSPNLTTGSIHQGVFLNQGADWQPPYYSVKAHAVQDLPLFTTGVPTGNGRTHKFYFQNWSGSNVIFQNSNALETPVVFTQDGAFAQAKFKGTQLSSTSNAFNSNSQRKYVKTNDGCLHLVYESMGTVWYETSIDNGVTWILQNNDSPLSTAGKQPSMDINSFFNPMDNVTYYQVVIVWQEQVGNASKIKIGYFYRTANSGSYMCSMGTKAFDVNSNYISENCTPVIGLDNDNNFKIVFRQSSSNGLLCQLGSVYTEGGITFSGSPVGLTGTTGNSINPSLAVLKLGRPGYKLVWEEVASANNSSIMCATLSGSQLVGINNASNTSSYPLNFAPSISFANQTPIISWTVGVNTGGVISYRRAATRVNYWGAMQIAGTNVNYVNNNSANNTTEKSVISWSEGTTNPICKWMRRNSGIYAGPYGLGKAGIQSQVCNGSDLPNMSAMAFNIQSTPYYFSKSTVDFSQYYEEEIGPGLNKITENDTIVTFGRSGVVSINDIEFVFEIGDILVGDSTIRFVEIPDTLIYNTTSEINQHTRTNNFMLTPTTNFYFSNIYHVLQKSNPDTALTTTDAVNFKVELVNAITDQVVGTFDNVTYSKNNLEKYASIDYEVDCLGIITGDYYLRLATNITGEAILGLVNLINENTTLAKKNFNKVKFTGSEIPITYDLAQNFPNPFNPSTTIRYQIPQDGIVTLKIYDILGAEVKTLVNEQKAAGKYEVNFNASSLASGVYIYKIQSGDFINSKKMLLLK